MLLKNWEMARDKSARMKRCWRWTKNSNKIWKGHRRPFLFLTLLEFMASYVFGTGGTILKFKQKSVRLSGSFSHRFTWTGNHNRTPIISDGATESGGKVSGHRFGGAFSRFCNFGFRVSAWITTLCHLVAFSQKSCFPKESKKKGTRDETTSNCIHKAQIWLTSQRLNLSNILTRGSYVRTSCISTPQRCSDFIL